MKEPVAFSGEPAPCHLYRIEGAAGHLMLDAMLGQATERPRVSQHMLMGMETSLSRLKAVGPAPVYLAVLLFIWLLTSGYGLTRLFTWLLG